MDECNRVLVLRNVGYLVEDCPSINDVRSAFQQGIEPEALLFSKSYAVERGEAVLLARSSCSQAPLIRFEDMDDAGDEPNFDLVIPPLTTPGAWLQAVAATIERSHILQARSIAIRERSDLLRRQSEILRQECESEFEKSARQRRIAEKVILEFRKWPKSSDET